MNTAAAPYTPAGPRGPPGAPRHTVVQPLQGRPGEVVGNGTVLAGDVGGAVVNLAVEHDPAADAGPDRQPDDVLRPARRAPPPLAEDRAVGVVVERRREPQRC